MGNAAIDESGRTHLDATNTLENAHRVRQALGFRDGAHGAHSARTIMLAELEQLLSALSAGTRRQEYERAIVEDNLLGKPTMFTRKATATRLWELYGLDPSVPLFRLLRLCWAQDRQAHPLLALSCALARDPLLRLSAPYILELNVGATTTADDLMTFLDEKVHGRFSATTLQAVAQRICSSWTQSGHLKGKPRRVRIQAKASPSAAAYAMFLGFAEGCRSERLFGTLWARLLDRTQEEIADLVAGASRIGLLSFRRIGTMVDIRFDDILTEAERELLR